MAETPPPGSLLSNFLSGGPFGRKPNLNRPKNVNLRYELPGGVKKKVEGYINPSKLPPDQAALVGGQFGSIPLNAAEDFFRGVKDELVGTGTINRFGGEDKVVNAAFDYAKTATDSQDPNLLKELQIDTPVEFGSRYRLFLLDQQAQENKRRNADGKPEIKGIGNYEVNKTALPPTKSAVGLGKQALALRVEDSLKGIDQLATDHPEVSVFNKQEMLGNVPDFLHQVMRKKADELAWQIKSAQVPAGPAVHALYNKLVIELAKFEQDKSLPEEARKSKINLVKRAIRDRVFSQTFLRQVPKALGRLYREVSELTGNPLGFGFKWTVAKPVQKYILGGDQIFGKLGLNLGFKFKMWLEKQGLLGKAVKGASSAVERGLGGLIRGALYRAGRFLTRGLVGVASRAAAWAIGGLVATVGAPFLLILGGIFIVTVVLTLFVMIVLAPFFMGLNSSVSAAPLDLAIIATASPSTDVGPETQVRLTLQLTTDRNATDVATKVTYDNHFDPAYFGGDGTSSGLVVTLPTIASFPSGQTTTWQVLSKTTSAMTTTTIALIKIDVTTSNNLSSSATVALNGAGIYKYDTNYPYGWPMNGQITQGLHTNNLLKCQNDNLTHCGTAVDIGGDHQKVCATMDGKVVAISDGFGLTPSYGPWIYNETSGYMIVYAHMEYLGQYKLAVKVGDTVHRGQLLGYSDTTGVFGTGAHLHYGIYTSKPVEGVGPGPGTSFSDYVPDPVVAGFVISDAIGC